MLQHRTCKAFHIKTGATQNGTVATSYEKTEQFPESHKCGTRQWRKMINQQLQKSIDIFEESRKRSWRESYNSGQTPATNTLQATHTHSVGEKTQCTEQMTTNATNNLLHFTAHHQHDSKTPLPRQTSSFCQKLRAYIWALCTLSNMSSSHQHWQSAESSALLIWLPHLTIAVAQKVPSTHFSKHLCSNCLAFKYILQQSKHCLNILSSPMAMALALAWLQPHPALAWLGLAAMKCQTGSIQVRKCEVWNHNDALIFLGLQQSHLVSKNRMLQHTLITLLLPSIYKNFSHASEQVQLQAQIYTNYNTIITVLPLLLWSLLQHVRTKHATFACKETRSVIWAKTSLGWPLINNLRL